MFVAGVIGFSACEKDDAAPLNKEEAQQEIQTSEAQVSTINSEITNSEGYKVQAELINIGLPFDYNYYKMPEISKNSSEFVENLKAKLNVISKQKSGDFDFNFDYLVDLSFEENVGTWTWTADGWQHTSTPTNEIIVMFPYPATNATNNAKLTYYDYTTKLVYGEKYPTGLKCKIEIGTQKVFSFVYSASIPSLLKQSSSLVIEFGKFSVISEESFDASSTSKLLMNGSFTVKKDGSIVYKQSASIAMTPKGDQDMHVLIIAKLRFLTLEFRIKIEYDLSQLNSETFNFANVLEMSLYTIDGAKVGVFKFIYSTTEQKMILYFIYNDGTQIPAYEAFDKLGYILENFWYEVLDDSEELKK